MDKELVTNFRLLYKGFQAEKEELERKKERFELLKEDPKLKEYFKLLNDDKVKEYFELQKDLTKDDNKTTEEEFLSRIYCSIHDRVKDTNGIYVCLGRGYPGYQVEDGKYIICSPVPLDKKVLVACYKNIETYRDGYIIPVSECEKFEKTHTVLPVELHDLHSTLDSCYGEMSLEYICDILELGNEKATEKLLSKYK